MRPYDTKVTTFGNLDNPKLRRQTITQESEKEEKTRSRPDLNSSLSVLDEQITILTKALRFHPKIASLTIRQLVSFTNKRNYQQDEDWQHQHLDLRHFELKVE